MFITVEGIDGSGKTTQIENIVEQISQFRERYNVFTTREPGWNRGVSGILRHMILEGETNAITKLYLLLADRSEHYEKYITPVLNRQAQMAKQAGYGRNTLSEVIVCDRGPDSTVAYQGFGENLAPVPFLVEANRVAMQGIRPNITFLLDVDPEVALKRVRNHTYFEKRGLDFQKRVRTGFLEIAKHEQDRVIVIDANQNEDAVFDQINRHLHRILGL